MKLIYRIAHKSNTYTNKPSNDIVITHGMLFVK